MKHEFEAKAIKINKEETREKLKNLGASLVFPEQKFVRITFDTPKMRKENSWVRLRTEYKKTTLAFKNVSDDYSIQGIKEASFKVDSFEEAKIFVEQLGLSQKNYQENLREEWELDDIIFEIDTWPNIDPYLEIEAPTEEKVKEYFQKLNVDYSKAVFGSVDVLYRDVYDIDILTLSRLTFEA